MVLVSSNKYQEAKAKLKLAMQTCGNIEGEGRIDHELLTKLDQLLADIDLLLHPSTDER